MLGIDCILRADGFLCQLEPFKAQLFADRNVKKVTSVTSPRPPS